MIVINPRHKAAFSLLQFLMVLYPLVTIMYLSLEYNQTYDTPFLVDFNNFRPQKVLTFSWMLCRMMKHLENVHKNPNVCPSCKILERTLPQSGCCNHLVIIYTSVHPNPNSYVANLGPIDSHKSAVTDSPLLPLFSCLSYWLSRFGLSCSCPATLFRRRSCSVGLTVLG